MLTRFTLADKISMTIIMVGVSAVLLVYYISDSYKQLSHQHHIQAIQQVANLEIIDLIDDLNSNSLDLALAIENESDFKRDFKSLNTAKITEHLDNQFYQYFVTAGVIKLLKLYIIDTDFTLISVSREGTKTDLDSELICPRLSQLAQARYGSEKLQTLSHMCLYKNNPVHAVIVPFGGLNPKGYIQVITDLSYNLQQIEKSLAMPLQLSLLNNKAIYQSSEWEKTEHDTNFISVPLTISNSDNTHIMNAAIKPDMTQFNKELSTHRNGVMLVTFIVTALIIFIVLTILKKSALQPLAKIHDVLEKIHSHSHHSNNEGDSRILFEQLLEHIIKLRHKSKTRFSVMMLDLTRFKDINEKFGNEVGDKLLLEVEKRLSTVLRDSDLISWVGTDTPGHKLLPTDTKTQYRATIARLGGDEFGLVLPSAETVDQATAVALRIVDMLNSPFEISEHTINIECKVGISLYPIHGDDEKVLIRNADKAMQQAKSNNQSHFIFHSETTEV